MTDHSSELRTLFDELVQLERAERGARLGEIRARDEALHTRLAAMLEADAESETRLQEYAAAAARSILATTAPRMLTDPLGLVGRTVGQYRIDALLGAGGMGVVYRATDLRLGRVAALKFLPPVLSLDDLAKQRFLHEARAASSLDDANVCTIYEADEAADGTLYIAMACYEGETLDARLIAGPLDMDEALDLAAQAARGLAAAHARGLVHRDIKPANLLVTTEGTVKILDFGIAKAGDAGLTMIGQRPGTAAYMAPEQARGEAVDGRADLWSLGMVLYQMLTGARPAAAGQAGERAPAPSTLRPEVPAVVDALVLDMLEHDPADRPQRAEDVVAVMERHAAHATAGHAAEQAGPMSRLSRRRVYHVNAGRTARSTAAPEGSRAVAYTGVGILIALVGVGSYAYLQNGWAPVSPTEAMADAPRMVAVLPFANTSPEAENEYFASGVTDDIRTHLALVPDFSVTSRTTALRYKGSDKSVAEIAEELGVQYVLEGSVQRVADRVRITVQLVDGRADRHLWAQTYDRQLEDIFAVQTDIAEAIVEALEARLSGDVASRITRRPTGDLEAYDLFLLGRESLYRYDPEGIRGAMVLFERALERDVTFALARAWLGRALAMYVHNQGLGPTWADSAVALGHKAIADQPDLSDAYNALGTALWVSGGYEEGVAAFERALELNPSDEIATHNLGDLSAWRGALDDAIRLTRRSLQLEPARSHQAYSNLTFYYAALGLFDQAEGALERALALAPESQGVLHNQARLELMRGRRDAAVRAATRFAGYGTDDPGAAHDAAHVFVWAGEVERARDAAEAAYARSPIALRVHLIGVLYGYALDRTGEPERARQVLAETERYAQERIEAGHEAAGLRFSLACLHAVRGEREEAFHWLDQAVTRGWNFVAMTASDPLLDNLRDDPRFQSLLDRMERSLVPMRARVEREGW